MNFTNEQLALIGTLMYCEGITDTRGNLETRLREMFYNGKEGDIENLRTCPHRVKIYATVYGYAK